METNIIRRFLRTVISLMIMFVVSQVIMILYCYGEATDVMRTMFSELTYIVASDNCLDDTVRVDGKTNYQRFEEALEVIDSEAPYISFDSTSIDVEYTDRDTAPQRYEPIRISLRGDMVYTFTAFRGYQFRIPIEESMNVIGTKYYRDR